MDFRNMKKINSRKGMNCENEPGLKMEERMINKK